MCLATPATKPIVSRRKRKDGRGPAPKPPQTSPTMIPVMMYNVEQSDKTLVENIKPSLRLPTTVVFFVRTGPSSRLHATECLLLLPARKGSAWRDTFTLVALDNPQRCISLDWRPSLTAIVAGLSRKQPLRHSLHWLAVNCCRECKTLLCGTETRILPQV